MPETATDDGDRDIAFDAPDGSAATIETHGDPLRSFLTIVQQVDDEARFQFGPDALTVAMVDPANVGMVDTTWPGSGMTAYQSDDIEVGMPLSLTGGADLDSALGYARRGRGNDPGDPVRIDVYDDDASTRVRVAVIREDQSTKRVSWFFGIDPDSLRMRPDLPDISLTYRADPSPDAFVDAVQALNDHEHAFLAGDGRSFIVASQQTDDPMLDLDDDHDVIDTVEMPNRAWSIDDPDADIDGMSGSLFSMDYLDDFADGLDDGKVSRITVSFDTEFPLKLAFEHTDWGFSGQYMLAPRISSDD